MVSTHVLHFLWMSSRMVLCDVCIAWRSARLRPAPFSDYVQRGRAEVPMLCAEDVIMWCPGQILQALRDIRVIGNRGPFLWQNRCTIMELATAIVLLRS
jgi:hypothetical protein